MSLIIIIIIHLILLQKVNVPATPTSIYHQLLFNLFGIIQFCPTFHVICLGLSYASLPSILPSNKVIALSSPDLRIK